MALRFPYLTAGNFKVGHETAFIDFLRKSGLIPQPRPVTQTNVSRLWISYVDRFVLDAGRKRELLDQANSQAAQDLWGDKFVLQTKHIAAAAVDTQGEEGASSYSKGVQPNAKPIAVNDQAAQASPKVINSMSFPTSDSEYNPKRSFLSIRREDSEHSPHRPYLSTRRRKDQSRHHRLNRQHHSPPLLQTSQNISEASLPVPHVVKRPDDDFLPSPSDVEGAGYWPTSRHGITSEEANVIIKQEPTSVPETWGNVIVDDNADMPAGDHHWHAEGVYGADMNTSRLYQALKKAPKQAGNHDVRFSDNGKEERSPLIGSDAVSPRQASQSFLVSSPIIPPVRRLRDASLLKAVRTSQSRAPNRTQFVKRPKGDSQGQQILDLKRPPKLGLVWGTLLHRTARKFGGWSMF
ncbi:MAG: hypothetical protein M1835_002509 [Candelina submexicana]|nr:MAG: hypothetical protein M1835_002509 [Candelina submexicana]